MNRYDERTPSRNSVRPRGVADTISFSTTDQWGRSALLTSERWDHITEGHPELESHRDDVIEAAAVADIRRRGNFPGAEPLYAEEIGPSRWLVVVADEEDRGRIITAYAQKKAPKQAGRL